MNSSSQRLTFVLDGDRIASLESFYDEFSRVILPGQFWGKNLDALDEILSGDWLPNVPVIEIIWANSHNSKTRLGYEETVRQLETRLQHCHPLNRPILMRELEAARQQKGPTVFDWLLEIFKEREQLNSMEQTSIALKLE